MARNTSIKNRSAPIYKRVVVKAGTNVLTNRSNALDNYLMSSLVSQMADLQNENCEILLVTSGAIAAGKEILGREGEGRTVSGRQVFAAVGQSRLMYLYQDHFSHHGTIVAQALLTRHDLEDRLGYLNVRSTLENLLERKVIPIINENDVVNDEEIGSNSFGDNDFLSALVANLIDADLLVLLTDTDGLHTSDPHKNPSAILLEIVDQIDESILAQAEVHEGDVSRGGMRAKLEAAKLATSGGTTVIIARGARPQVIRDAVYGAPVGTHFPARGTQLENRKRWMLSTLAEGTLEIDQGATSALLKGGKSLLPPGIVGLQGEFARGDLVSIINSQGKRIACGITNYNSTDLNLIKGVKSDQIISHIGHHFGDEVIHRNNMVIL